METVEFAVRELVVIALEPDTPDVLDEIAVVQVFSL
jgi:hypothetical protein